MQIICLDFETLFDQEFTLSKMTTEEYIRDARFSAHGVSIKWGKNHEPKWYTHDEFAYLAKQEDWSKYGIICHHAHFDSLILSHHYGVFPAKHFCTLSMARLVHGNHVSVGLESLAKLYNKSPKTVPYNEMRGKRWHEMPPYLQQKVADGANHDVQLTWDLFGELIKEFPPEELEVIDSTIRMFVEPVLRADTTLLAKVWQDEDTKKKKNLAVLNVSKEELQSAEKFATLLRAEGVEPGLKENPKGEMIYAFAKTDQFMRDLLEHEDDRVRTLAEARLDQKSTFMQTRSEAIGWMASRGPLCVYYNYAGAHNLNWSGGDSLNFQNIKRGSAIRKALMAPDGYLFASPDMSQVQCRMLNYVAGQWDVVERFRNNEDPYIPIAEKVYNKSVTKDDKTERGTGKQLELSCGFMAGDKSIQSTAKLGIYGPPVYIELQEARRWKNLYRDEHPQVVEFWKTAGRMIARIAGGSPLQWGLVWIKDGKVYLPNGAFLQYPKLHFYTPTAEECEKLDEYKHKGFWRYKTRKGWETLHPGILTQNVVSSLSRLLLSQAMLRLKARGYQARGTTHDELWFLIKKDGCEEKHKAVLIEEMSHTPSWAPGLPLDCECEMGERYEH